MTSRRSKRYWRRVFEGETGDMVKNILTDGQWKPSKPYGNEYKSDTTTAWAIFLVILIGAVGFGAWKFLEWIW